MRKIKKYTELLLIVRIFYFVVIRETKNILKRLIYFGRAFQLYFGKYDRNSRFLKLNVEKKKSNLLLIVR